MSRKTHEEVFPPPAGQPERLDNPNNQADVDDYTFVLADKDKTVYMGNANPKHHKNIIKR